MIFPEVGNDNRRGGVGAGAICPTELPKIRLHWHRIPTTLSFDLEVETMPKYVIEREIPNVGSMSPEELKAVSQTSCGVLQEMGPKIQWVESFVTADKVYCIYVAPDADAVREHAEKGGFPANSISEVKTMIDPTTAE